MLVFIIIKGLKSGYGPNYTLVESVYKWQGSENVACVKSECSEIWDKQSSTLKTNWWPVVIVIFS